MLRRARDLQQLSQADAVILGAGSGQTSLKGG